MTKGSKAMGTLNNMMKSKLKTRKTKEWIYKSNGAIKEPRSDGGVWTSKHNKLETS